MTREEAAEVLKQYEKAGTRGLMHKLPDALKTALDALRGPVPDPETGLVPCGCGGKPKLHVWQSNGGNISVTCPNCTMQITGIGDEEVTERSIQYMRDLWNAAMGCKEEEE
jgi:hypothetical protein